MADTLIPSDSVDALVARQLPSWLRGVDIDLLLTFQRALRYQQAAADSVRKRLDGLPGLDAFARPLLEAALSAQGLPGIDVLAARVVIEQKVALPSAAPRLHEAMQTLHSSQSLLAAALHNFHESETFAALHRRAHLLDAQGQVLALPFETFARLCRQLDLGGQYQQLLRARLFPKSRPPASADFAQAAVRRSFEEHQRAGMEVAVRMARIRGQLDEAPYLRLLPLIARQPVTAAGPGTVMPRQLYLLGKCVEGGLVLELRETAEGPLQNLVCWLPADPVRAITQHTCWDALFDDMGVRLRKPGYARYFARFITERDRPAFTTQLERLIKTGNSHQPLELDGRHFAIEEPVFAYLRGRLMQKMLDDARVLAVPTVDQTILERHQRLEALKGAGLELVNLAALFIPGLGEAMLVAAAADIAGEVYGGYEAWRLGDRQGALDHLFNVAQTFAIGALQGVGQAGAGYALERFGFVDALTPVYEGQCRFRLRQLPEPPHYLDDAGVLVRKFAGALADTSDDAANALLHITGLTCEGLRGLHLQGEPAPARLVDAHARNQLHSLEPLLRPAAVERALMAQTQAPSPAAAQLMHTFTGLTVQVAEEILHHATGEQVATLGSGKVPLALAERARWAVRESRLDRALMGLQHATAVNEDTLRLALALLDQIAPWMESVRVEVRQGEPQGRVLACRGAPGSLPTWVIVRTSDGFHLEGGGPQATDQTLLDCLLMTLDGPQKNAFGGAQATAGDLGDGLLRQASVDRAAAAQAMGLAAFGGRFRPPRRLQDGRVGYPLSGRGESSRQALRYGIRAIYPMLSDAQLDAYIQRLIDQGIGLWDHLGELELRLHGLRQALEAWERQRISFLDGRRRRRVATQIRRAWRRKTGEGERGDYVLHVVDERVGSLPSLPADIDFQHVRRLTLRNLGLEQIRAEFLLRFPQLHELDLRENQLTQLPAGLELLGQLRVLRLGRNRIALGPRATETLGRLAQLEVLDLSSNPLGLMPDLSGLRGLREVYLRGTGLQDLGDGAQLPWRGLADFRENQIREVSAQLQTLGGRLQQLYLHDNPLDEVSRRLLNEASGMGEGAGRASPVHMIADNELRDRWIGQATAEVSSRYRQIWADLIEERESADLFRFLADFAESEDFNERAHYYRARIWRILELCSENTDVREAVFLQVQGPQTCDDRLLLLLSQLELRLHIALHTAGIGEAQTESALVRLGRSLYRLDEVDRIAAVHIRQMRRDPYALVDDIEVYLAYRVNLAQRLGLPVQPAYMNFPEFSGVSSRQIRLAGDTVLAEESRSALSAALAQREFWQAFVRTRYRERFEALAAPFHERLEACEQQTAQTGEQAYLDQAATLMAELNAQEQALYLALATQANERG